MIASDADERLRWAWIAGGAALGGAAGLPWVDTLSGPLPSVVFAVFGALEARRRWDARREAFWTWPAAACLGLALGLLDGLPGTSTWPDACFRIAPRKLEQYEGLFLGASGLAGVVSATLAALILRWQSRRMDRLRQRDPDRAWLAVALGITCVGVGWSLVNQVLLPDGILSFFGSSLPLGHRHPCYPEVGWVGAAHYAVAMITLRYARSAARGWPGAAFRIPVTTVLVGVLLVAQLGRTAELLHRELPMLKSHGGPLDCGCLNAPGAWFNPVSDLGTW